MTLPLAPLLRRGFSFHRLFSSTVARRAAVMCGRPPFGKDLLRVRKVRPIAVMASRSGPAGGPPKDRLRRSNREPETWIASSASPPRNDVEYASSCFDRVVKCIIILFEPEEPAMISFETHPDRYSQDRKSTRLNSSHVK